MSVLNRNALRWILMAALVTAMAAGNGYRGQATDWHIVSFNGPHRDGDVAVEEYLNLGLYISPGPYGGPYFEDAGGLSFLLHTPPFLLSLSPLAPVGFPGQVHASPGTYEFRFVDPTNKWAPSVTEEVAILLVFSDVGTYVMTAYDKAGGVVGEVEHTRGYMDLFEWDTLYVAAEGIHRVTLTTPPEPSLGALVDTLYFTPVPQVVHEPMKIEVSAPRRNVISLAAQFLTIAILSSPDLDPRDLNPNHVLVQGIGPAQYAYQDRNGDHVPDLIVQFQLRRLEFKRRDVVTVTAVEQDGTPYRATQEVLVVGRRSSFNGG